MNKDFQGPLYCLKKPVHSPAEKNAGWAIYGEGKGTQTKTEREGLAAIGWCNEPCCNPWKFFELYPTQTNSSNYLSKQRILNTWFYCLQFAHYVDMTPWQQPIRWRHEDCRLKYLHKMLRIFIKTMGGVVRLLLSGDCLPVMSGLQTINDDI